MGESEGRKSEGGRGVKERRRGGRGGRGKGRFVCLGTVFVFSGSIQRPLYRCFFQEFLAFFPRLFFIPFLRLSHLSHLSFVNPFSVSIPFLFLF